MDDTLSIKDLDMTTLDSANFPGSAKAFPRVASPNTDWRRQNLAIDSRSPSVFRITHTPISAKNAIQRSSFMLDQRLTRVDSDDNPISEDSFTVGLVLNRPSGVSEAEYLAGVQMLLGALVASSGSNLKALYNGEY